MQPLSGRVYLRSVNVKFLRPGQIIADVVTNANGAVLCPMGFKLTEQSIQRLKNSNIATVWIEGNPKPGIDPTARLAALEKRFAGVQEPALLAVKGLLKKRFQDLKDEYSG